MNRDAAADAIAVAGITQTEWARSAEVSPSTLSGLMAGTHRASVPVATRLARAVRFRRGTLFPSLVGLPEADLAEAVPA